MTAFGIAAFAEIRNSSHVDRSVDGTAAACIDSAVDFLVVFLRGYFVD